MERGREGGRLAGRIAHMLNHSSLQSDRIICSFKYFLFSSYYLSVPQPRTPFFHGACSTYPCKLALGLAPQRSLPSHAASIFSSFQRLNIPHINSPQCTYHCIVATDLFFSSTRICICGYMPCLTQFRSSGLNMVPSSVSLQPGEGGLPLGLCLCGWGRHSFFLWCLALCLEVISEGFPPFQAASFLSFGLYCYFLFCPSPLALLGFWLFKLQIWDI